MKKLLTISLIALLSALFVKPVVAQTEDSRTKLQLTIVFQGKSIVTDLNSVSTSLSRSYEDLKTVSSIKDSVKNSLSSYYPGALYITVDAKKVSDDLLRVFAKKQTRFDGMITVVDSFGKNPPRTIKFKQASLYTYSDNLSGTTYSDAYGSVALSFSCKDVSINGIPIEQ
ncbi:type VI secretion system tube protein TssD [Mucilaginibacter sp.]